jgi:hypothetical protein
MSTKYFDILVAKEFETRQGGQLERRTVWNKVGQAWPAKSPGSFNFELFLMPGQRYFISMREEPAAAQTFDEVPF